MLKHYTNSDESELKLNKGHKFLLNTIMALDLVDGSLKQDNNYKRIMSNLEECNSLMGTMISDGDTDKVQDQSVVSEHVCI